MTSDESDNFTTAGGMADHHGILEAEVVEELVQVVSVGVHVVAIPIATACWYVFFEITMLMKLVPQSA